MKLKKPILRDAEELLNFLRSRGLFPDDNIIEGCSTNLSVNIHGKSVIMFGSNNYLGLAADDEVKRSAVEGLKKYGLGSGGSRLVSGNTDIQNILESELARLKAKESAVLFATGYMANIGLMKSLANSIYEDRTSPSNGTVIFSDRLNHASIIDGIKISGSQYQIYKHLDVLDLEEKLRRTPRSSNKIIVTDGVFSTLGDIAPLPSIVELAEEHDAVLVVDDAHGTGVLGENGGGTAEYFGLSDRIDLIMGTLTKSVGGIGGFVAGDKYLVDYLRVSSYPYIFSAPIPPGIASGALQSLRIMGEKGKEFRKIIKENTRYIREKLLSRNYILMGSPDTPIVPVYIGKDCEGISISRMLLEEGFFVPCFRWPAMPRNASILRIIVNALHKREDIDRLVEAFDKIQKKKKT